MVALTEKGLYCEAGDFYIDPTRKAELALITHAHSDHARPGSAKYVCASPGVSLLARRVGQAAPITGVSYRKKMRFGSVEVSFHPAGHILGSAQIRIESDGGVCVVSGDYKRDNDPTCEPFEVLKCDTFITEATFGHPKYVWKDTADEVRQVYEWWQENRNAGKNSLLYCYALGKSQRVLGELLAHTEDRVLVFGETGDLTDCYRAEGVKMVPTERLEEVGKSKKLKGELIVAPHSIGYTTWIERLGYPPSAFASGWMGAGGRTWGRGYDRGFVISDHADWPGLVRTIEETGARRVGVLHEGDGSLVRHLRKLGIAADVMLKPSQMLKRGPAQGDLFSRI